MTRSQSSSLSALPFDLVEEILVRIPATSLQRLRSTCKQWNVLLNDQRFTKKHFDKAEKQFLVVMLKNYGIFSTRLNLLRLHDNNDPSSIDLKGEFSLIHPRYNSQKVYVNKVFHCNGLLLCTALTGLVVWNPCTGQTKWIKITDMNHEGKYTYALGYESNKSCCNDKILKLSHIKTFDSEIYDLNSHSWRVLGNITPDLIISQRGVSLKGNTYRLAYKEEDEESIDDFLICFDFTTETFGPRLCLPVKSYCYMDTISISCVREERLSVFFQDDTLKMEIWISNNISESKAMSWSPFLKIDLNTHRFGTDLCFFIDEENKMIVCCDKKSSSYHDLTESVYIIGENHYWRKVELERRSDRLRGPRMVSYVPSLVQI